MTRTCTSCSRSYFYSVVVYCGSTTFHFMIWCLVTLCWSGLCWPLRVCTGPQVISRLSLLVWCVVMVRSLVVLKKNRCCIVCDSSLIRAHATLLPMCAMTWWLLVLCMGPQRVRQLLFAGCSDAGACLQFLRCVLRQQGCLSS